MNLLLLFLLNRHRIKLASKFLSLYPQVSTTLEPPEVLSAVDGVSAETRNCSKYKEHVSVERLSTRVTSMLHSFLQGFRFIPKRGIKIVRVRGHTEMELE